MPTYEYACDACGHKFELFQSMTAPVKRTCPKCRKPKLRRLVGTGAGVIFKGGGFYETDYRSDSYKKAAEADKKSAGDAKKDDGATKKAEPKSDSTSSSKETKKPARKKAED